MPLLRDMRQVERRGIKPLIFITGLYAIFNAEIKRILRGQRRFSANFSVTTLIILPLNGWQLMSELLQHLMSIRQLCPI